MIDYFKETLAILTESLETIDDSEFFKMLYDCNKALTDGHKIIVSGLGKNVPICEKFVGSMVSMGMNATFLHTNSAVHGDLGVIKNGDVVIILTKSGSTSESVHLKHELDKRNVTQWLLTFEDSGVLAKEMKNVLHIKMKHEGDQWNIVPNNSTILNLIILQTIAMELSKLQNITLEQFKFNHPGGHIGEILKMLD